jgi:uncharacterized membrane protein YjgN (DUF898 family)
MQEPQPDSAFSFRGSWQEFAPIAFTNLLLTIVTLGIYSFWAKARERRYLWSRTRFIDDRLEWTGTGLELFIGYIMTFVLLGLPLILLNLVIQGSVLRGEPGIAGLLILGLYVVLLLLVGVAVFRALRYRLSRTYWHGIRGGSDDNGFAFGVQYLWRSVVGVLPLGLGIPWSMTSLWNLRWSAMSFGPFRFSAHAEWGKLMGRFLAFYLAPFLLVAAGLVLGGAMMSMMANSATPTPTPPGAGTAVLLLLSVVGVYVALGLIALSYYAAYFREAVGSLRLSDLEFGFTARTKDWLLLFLGNIALVIVTLGIGLLFIPYRNWRFLIRHLEGFGHLDLSQLTQSTTRRPGQGEGLLDAFDVGAF